MASSRELHSMAQCPYEDQLQGVSLEGSHWDPFYNILISDTDSGIECAHIRLADDRKLSGEADTLEERGANHRDLDRHEKRVHINPMKFSKAMCKVLHLGSDKPQYQYGMNRL